MKYLHGLNLHCGDLRERKIFICSSAIDYFRARHGGGFSSESGSLDSSPADYTSIFSNVCPIDFVVKAAPDMLNQITFDGLFFKVSAMILNRGNQDKFIAFINPDNIYMVDETLPNTCTVNFESGKIILINQKNEVFVAGLVEHVKKYRERKNMSYGKS